MIHHGLPCIYNLNYVSFSNGHPQFLVIFVLSWFILSVSHKSSCNLVRISNTEQLTWTLVIIWFCVSWKIGYIARFSPTFLSSNCSRWIYKCDSSAGRIYIIFSSLFDQYGGHTIVWLNSTRSFEETFYSRVFRNSEACASD